MGRKVIHSGSCHCGAIKYAVTYSEEIRAEDCNCSICRKSGYLHLIVPRNSVHIREGRELLTTYTFNTSTAKHMFCRICGVKSYYVPRSHPTGYSINVHTIDSKTISALDIHKFDGRNWEDNVAKLASSIKN